MQISFKIPTCLLVLLAYTPIKVWAYLTAVAAPLCYCEWNISNAVTTEVSQHIYPTGAFLCPKKYPQFSLTSCSARLHFDFWIRNYCSSHFSLCQVLLMHFVIPGLGINFSLTYKSHYRVTLPSFWMSVNNRKLTKLPFFTLVNFKQLHNLGFTEAN